jgi:hypothetical protein
MRRRSLRIALETADRLRRLMGAQGTAGALGAVAADAFNFALGHDVKSAEQFGALALHFRGGSVRKGLFDDAEEFLEDAPTFSKKNKERPHATGSLGPNRKFDQLMAPRTGRIGEPTKGGPDFFDHIVQERSKDRGR